MSPSPFSRRLAYYAALAAAEEIEARPDANVFDRCGAWARVQAARVAMSLHEQGAAYAALDRAEGTVA